MEDEAEEEAAHYGFEASDAGITAVVSRCSLHNIDRG